MLIGKVGKIVIMIMMMMMMTGRIVQAERVYF